MTDELPDDTSGSQVPTGHVGAAPAPAASGTAAGAPEPVAPGHPVRSGVVVNPSRLVRATTIDVARIASIGLGAGALLALLGVAIVRRGAAVQAVDDDLHAWVLASRSDFSISVARAISWGGTTALTLPALVLVGALALRGSPPARVRLGAGALLATVAGVGVSLGLALNSWIGRERPPSVDWLGAAGGPAFPSGHTTAATLFALSCGWVLTARFRPGRPRTAFWAAAGTYALLVGWSRVWLGVHWPADVLGGWLYAVTWSALVAVVIAGFRRHRSRLSLRERPQARAVGEDALTLRSGNAPSILSTPPASELCAPK